jgi:hypothetical protein
MEQATTLQAESVMRKIDKQWVCLSGEWYLSKDLPDIKKKLPPGIYELCIGLKGPFLKIVQEEFVMPEKMYGLETKTVDKVLKTFGHSSVMNLGVLFKGLKGTGKTITAKVICKKLNIPVILITNPSEGVNEFINAIEQDIVLLFDEFEKVYQLYGNAYDDGDNNDNNNTPRPSIHQLLTLMDGIFTSKSKRLFLMTTNETYLPSALEARPSRIRYIQEFTDLTYEAMLEILETELEKPFRMFTENIIKAMAKYENITVDLVKCVAQEVNIYKTFTEDMLVGFNIKQPSGNTAKLYKVTYHKTTGALLKEEKLPGEIRSTDQISDNQWLPSITTRTGKQVTNGYISNVKTNAETGDISFDVTENATNKIVSFIARPDVFVHHNLKHVL